MQIEHALDVVSSWQDPRVVRSPGKTLEEMLLEQESESRWLLEDAADTSVIHNVRIAPQTKSVK